jgi:hypothetical protein
MQAGLGRIARELRDMTAWHGRGSGTADARAELARLWSRIEDIVEHRLDSATREVSRDAHAALRSTRAQIEHGRDAAHLVWDYQEASGKIRTYIWNESQDWLVIVEKQNRPKGTIYMLITSFLVKYESKRDDLERKYRQRIEWKIKRPSP